VTGNPQVTPIVIDGVMYLPARGNEVLALDADTGKEIWRYQMPQFITSDARGVAYWPGEAGLAPRVLLTAGPRLLALDAATGRPSAGFGRDGYVEIMVPWRGVPVIYRNLATRAAPSRRSPAGVRRGRSWWR
jgi:quinoprotein glucose dehydrogenase